MVHRTPFFLPLLYPSLTWKVATHEKELFLTFDDGPVPGPTEFVLDALARHNAKATFFCIGDNIAKHPDIFSQIASQGHAIGNHTFNHLSGWKTSTESYLDNTRRCDIEIKARWKGGQNKTQKLFRPPYGRITRRQIKALSWCKIIMWDVLSIDYRHAYSSEKCLRNTIDATRAGSIIVFHDSRKAEKNLTYALPRFMEHYSSLGYKFNAIAG